MGPPPGDDDATDDALAAVFRRRYQPMVRLATWLVGEAAAAEDLVQDAFVRLARRDLGDVASVDAYLRTTVVNLCRSRQRRGRLELRHRLSPLGPEPEPGELLADEELARAVAALPRRQRECVVLRFTEDLAVADIAAALGISPGSVKTHLHRGLAALGAALAPEPAPESRSAGQAIEVDPARPSVLPTTDDPATAQGPASRAVTASRASSADPAEPVVGPERTVRRATGRRP